MNTTTTTPAQVDQALSDLHGKAARAAEGARMYMDDMHYAVRDRQYRKQWKLTDAEVLDRIPADHEYRVKRDAYLAELDALRADIAELDKQYTGWSRFFLVANTGGHIHSTMNCGTCFPTTNFAWLPALSGQTEKEAVAEHGALLCSVCFPSAPVEWRNHWELEAERKKAESCAGSGTYNWEKAPDTGKVYPRGLCGVCGESVTPTSRYSGKIRRHKA